MKTIFRFTKRIVETDTRACYTVNFSTSAQLDASFDRVTRPRREWGEDTDEHQNLNPGQDTDEPSLPALRKRIVCEAFIIYAEVCG